MKNQGTTNEMNFTFTLPGTYLKDRADRIADKIKSHTMNRLIVSMEPVLIGVETLYRITIESNGIKFLGEDHFHASMILILMRAE